MGKGKGAASQKRSGASASTKPANRSRSTANNWQSANVADQLVELRQQSLQLNALPWPLGIDHFSHRQDARGIGQRQVIFQDGLHARQENPLQPLLEVQR